MYLGRTQLGKYITLGVLCVDANGTPVQPDAPPVMKVWNPAGTAIVNEKLPIVERYVQTGWFRKRLFLDSVFAVGQHRVTYTYSVNSSYYGLQEDGFDILDGGDPDGAVIGLHHLDKPHAGFVVKMLDSGALQASRNPRL